MDRYYRSKLNPFLLMIYTIGQTFKTFNRWIDTISVKHDQ
jgi:hypothetical protein